MQDPLAEPSCHSTALEQREKKKRRKKGTLTQGRCDHHQSEGGTARNEILKASGVKNFRFDFLHRGSKGAEGTKRYLKGERVGKRRKTDSSRARSPHCRVTMHTCHTWRAAPHREKRGTKGIRTLQRESQRCRQQDSRSFVISQIRMLLRSNRGA